MFILGDFDTSLGVFGSNNGLIYITIQYADMYDSVEEWVYKFITAITTKVLNPFRPALVEVASTFGTTIVGFDISWVYRGNSSSHTCIISVASTENAYIHNSDIYKVFICTQLIIVMC